MGAWSAAVLGSDAALDALGDIEDRFALADLYPLEQIEPETMSVLRASLEAAASELLTEALTWDPITGQVYAVLFMAAGAAIPEPLRDVFIASARDDEWAGEGEHRDRIEEMQLLMTSLTAYTGEPIIWHHTSLFERMQEPIRFDETD